MTRDDAIKIIKDRFQQTRSVYNPAEVWIVDALVALGLLKLDEPNEAHSEALRMLTFRYGSFQAEILLQDMHNAGLKIVKK